MRAFDFWIMMLCCLGWGGNFVVTSWALGGTSVQPFMLAVARACFVLLAFGYFLFRPLPEQFLRLLFVCFCVGPAHLGLLYTGLQTAPASGGSIISQAMIPMATLLSVVWLKEKIGWVRSVAIAVALIGVVIMIYEPGALSADVGLLYIFGAYVALAIGSVAMRRVKDVDWRVYVAWTAVMVLLLSTLMTTLFETGHADVWATDRMSLLIAAIYAAFAVSIFAHGQYFRLLQRYDVGQVVPLTIMVTVFASVLGVLLLDETLYLRYVVGAALILPCVWIIAKRGTVPPVEID